MSAEFATDRITTRRVTVSVIIPTYRREVSLKRALESVIKQSYEAVEMIVIDDNAEATWNSKVQNVVNEMRSLHPIIIIQNENNKGSAEARNIGIRAATGEYITFLDDDDRYLPDKIKNQVEYMLEQQADYCITDLNLYDEDEKLIDQRIRNYIKGNSKEELNRYHLLYHITGTDTLMFKREYLLNIGLFIPINVGDEFYLMHKAIEAGGIFSYLARCDVQAYVHTKTDGLSSGESKINGENQVYEYKKKYFIQMSKEDIRYIKMRHYAVLAFVEIRRKRAVPFIKNAFFSFSSSPVACGKLLLEKRLFFSKHNKFKENEVEQ